MTLLRLLCLSASLTWIACGQDVLTKSEWKTFESVKYRYRVRYPASWYLFTTPLAPKLDSLDILNFPPEEAARGVILKESGANITVGPAPPQIKTIDQWVQDDSKVITIIGQREVKELPRKPTGCLELHEVVAKQEMGPEMFFVYTGYYCRTSRGLFRILLVNRAEDPNQENLREIARKIALSLQSW